MSPPEREASFHLPIFVNETKGKAHVPKAENHSEMKNMTKAYRSLSQKVHI